MRLRRIIAHLTEQNWIAVILDFVIVVLGVFVGLQVSNWNEARHDAVRGDEFLERIHSDLTTDVAALDRRSVFWSDVVDYGDAALDFAENGKLRNGSAWDTLLAFYQASQIWPFTTSDGTYQELIAAGDLGLVSDSDLRHSLADYYVTGSRRLARRVDVIPAYREEIRGLTPMRIQRQIWAHCHRFLSDDRQLLIDCAAPITEVEARTILASYVESRETIKGLRFWMTDLAATSSLARLYKLEGEGLAARVAKKTR
ncbi:MAG TPA: hypothetical protein VK485_05505 [Sphingomicrobium sp.]|nr:hypothetical protein [Sphingomicrobium sp.]